MINKNSILKLSVILLSFFIFIWFQNCGIKGTHSSSSQDESTNFMYSQSFDNTLGSKNTLEIPKPIMGFNSEGQILGTCVIENPPRGITVSLNSRFGKSDCAEFCRINSLKFDRDRLRCRFENEYFLQLSASWFEKNHCTIKLNGSKTLDSFDLSKQQCNNQCIQLGQPLPLDQSLECLWQNQVLKFREVGGSELPIGSCKITVKVSNPLDKEKTLNLVIINYDSGTTEKHCNYLKDFFQTFFNETQDLREITQEFK